MTEAQTEGTSVCPYTTCAEPAGVERRLSRRPAAWHYANAPPQYAYSLAVVADGNEQGYTVTPSLRAVHAPGSCGLMRAYRLILRSMTSRME